MCTFRSWLSQFQFGCSFITFLFNCNLIDTVPSHAIAVIKYDVLRLQHITFRSFVVGWWMGACVCRQGKCRLVVRFSWMTDEREEMEKANKIRRETMNDAARTQSNRNSPWHTLINCSFRSVFFKIKMFDRMHYPHKYLIIHAYAIHLSQSDYSPAKQKIINYIFELFQCVGWPSVEWKIFG